MNPTVPKLTVSQLTLYNPSRLKDAEIIGVFVARKPVFQRVLDDIAAEQPESRAQHHLIIGQRGMGKSTLLARLAAELRTNPDLSPRFLPLVFAEEQYAVDRLSKFWLNCLDSLADAAERAGDQARADEIDVIVRGLKPRSGGAAAGEELAARAALDAFLAAAKSSGKRPVLLVDNLQLVFDRISGEQQHALREVLMRSGCPILVGASPSAPAQSQDYAAAFYDQFKTHYLKALSADEMRELMLQLAETTNQPDVRQHVLAHPARLNALRDLAGGNPRMVVMLFFLYTENFSPSMFADLENLLDRVTPLYKARIEELSEQQQVIVSAVADHWAPITARSVADVTGLSVPSTSSQLDRLEKIGFVEKVELHQETAAGFQIAERFFNVWFLMRNSSRRQRREVEFLVRFIESFYEARDGVQVAQQDHFRSDDGAEDVSNTLRKPVKPEDQTSYFLHEALLAAYDKNWGVCAEKLKEAMTLIGHSFPVETLEDWFRASAVLTHLNYGEELLTLLRELGRDISMRPWYEALVALHKGDRLFLQNIPVEVRKIAEEYYDQIEKRLNALPEKTRRRPLPAPPKKKRKS